MLARIGTIALTQSRYRRTTFLAASTAASVASYSIVECSCQSLADTTESSGINLVVPTLEATTRALRLVQTAVLMVVDYEFAKVAPYFESAKEIHDDQERAYWESELDLREKLLEKAQRKYANDHLNDNLPSARERKEAKVNQKEEMHQAAVALAEAEEHLTKMGGDSPKSKVHRKAAQRLLKLCRDNGGVYIKVGQHLANLDYLVPEEYIDVLSKLFDDNPETKYEDVCRVIEEEFGRKVEQLYDNFDPEPIASASLAQVHVAYEKETGRKLAVKVQHAGLRETSKGDVFAVTTVVRLIDSLFEDFTFGWIADEIAPNLPKELDFEREGRNSEKAAAYLLEAGLNCVVPKVIWNHTSSRVLTMEFEEGFKANDIDAIEKAGLSKHDVAKLISSIFNSQVFLSAWVHCDPHPANVLLRKKNGKPQIVLVDHGLYKELDDTFRVRYAELWMSLMMADLKGIETSCYNLGIHKAYTLFAAMLTARPFDEIIERSKTGSLSAPAGGLGGQADKAVIRGYAKQFLKDIFDLLGILPPQMLLLLKMNDCLRHIDYDLGSPTNTLVVAGKFASRAVYEDRFRRPGASLTDKFKAWYDYMKVLFKINVHDIGAWFLLTTTNFKLLKL